MSDSSKLLRGSGENIDGLDSAAVAIITESAPGGSGSKELHVARAYSLTGYCSDTSGIVIANAVAILDHSYVFPKTTDVVNDFLHPLDASWLILAHASRTTMYC